MYTIALTGGIGCGKSTVCKLFSALGIPIIDTDNIARELVEPGQPALEEIIACFGDAILLADGSLDRKALARKTFTNQQNRLSLESILHPRIRQCVSEQLSRLSSAYVIIAIPLLIETSQQNQYNKVLVIDCDKQQQIDRTLSRDQRSLPEIESIISSQVSREQRIAAADDVIDNTHDINSLEAQVNLLHSKFLNMAS